MKLNFESINKIDEGSHPNIVQFEKTDAEIFTVAVGEIFGKPIHRLNGQYGSPVFDDKNHVSPDQGVNDFELRLLNGFGAVGSYSTGTQQKMLIYEFAFELDRYLNDASINLSLGNPISSFTMTLDNPVDTKSDKQLNVAVSENHALIAPGAKIKFIFNSGNSEELEMGSFFIDRSDFTVLGETVSCDGRNTIGKALNDQTLDENAILPYNTIDQTLISLLENAQISSEKYLVEETLKKSSFTFDPNTTVLNAIKEILKIVINYKIEEISDGTIVIGTPNYPYFTDSKVFEFYRDRDIYSRQITRDDMYAYRKVCVHTGDFSTKVYREVKSYEGWNLLANKTLYVAMADGISQSDAAAYAEELASRVENVGKVETFTGPFRPYITPGDSAKIISTNHSEDIGLITDVTHRFGKQGFSTEFTVDSGGQVGKERLNDYINKLTQMKTSGAINYE